MRIQSLSVEDFGFGKVASVAKKFIVGAVAVATMFAASPNKALAGDFGIFGKNTVGGAGIGALIGAAASKDKVKGALTGGAVGAVAGTILDNVLPNGGETPKQPTVSQDDYDRQAELARAEELRLERERILQREREAERRRAEERALADEIRQSQTREYELATALARQKEHTKQLERTQVERYGYSTVEQPKVSFRR